MRRHATGLALMLAVFAIASGGNATSAGAACANEGLRGKQGSAFLPNCRAYEMVSPTEKGGVGIFRIQMQAQPAGGSLLFSSSASFGDSPSASRLNFYRSDRGSEGWMSGSVSAPIGERLLPQNSTLKGISEDFSAAVVESSADLTADPVPSGVATLYRRASDGTYELVIPKVPGGFEGVFYTPSFVAASAGFEHILFESEVPQTPDAPAGVNNLYEWHDGQVRLVTILPDADCAELGLPPGCAAPGGVQEFGAFPERRHFISADGSRIFFRTGGNLYMREDGSTTRQIGPDGASFEEATPDGGKVLYAVGSVHAGGLALHQYDTETESSTPIADPIIGMVGQSVDGAYVYFVSELDLADGGIAGAQNIYLAHDGSFDYIARLNPWGDSGDNKVRMYITMNDRALTPDGRFLVFHTVETPTGYDNSSPHCVFEEKCTEYYRYAADDGSLVCVSCNPNGPPNGDASTEVIETGITPTLEEAGPRYLSTDGSRVFFNSPDPLVGRDSNGLNDVYVWEEGVGARLLSTGRSEEGSFLLGSSASGDDAYLWTTQPLVGIDRDRLGDAYDARVEGGFDGQMPEPAPPPCAGEACRAAIVPPGAGTSPGSATFVGPAEAKPKRKKARRGKKRRHRAGKKRAAKREKKSKRQPTRAGRRG